MKALGIGTGDEVVTVSNTAIPTISAIVSTGATPVFVDIMEDTYLMNTRQIENVITEKTKCILPVHLYGQCVDMENIHLIAAKYHLFILEDCAQSHGARYKDQISGSMSDISTTSFYPTKILGTYGDGGMVNTNSEELDRKMRRLRFYGTAKNYFAIEHGYNSRLDELHASILLKKISHLNEYIQKRRMLAKQYGIFLSDTSLVLPFESDYGEHSYYLYVVRHPKRDQIIEQLKNDGIFVNISYPWPIHTMPGYKYLGYQEGDLPVTEIISKQIFSLPLYPSLTSEQQIKIIEVLHKIMTKFE